MAYGNIDSVEERNVALPQGSTMNQEDLKTNTECSASDIDDGSE